MKQTSQKGQISTIFT